MFRPRAPRKRPASRRALWRPRLEVLEDRCVPTTDLQLIGAGASILSYSGVGFRRNVAAGLTCYVNGQLDTTASDFSAQVDWQDGSGWQPAVIGSNNGGGGGTFLIKAGHVYSQVGTYHVIVEAFGPGGTSKTSQTVDAVVSNMPSGIPGITPPALTASLAPSNVDVNLIGAGATILSYTGVGFQENVAAGLTGYLNGQLDNQATDFHAFVNWGDTNQWFAADIGSNNGGGGGTFLVKASHVYAQAGTYHIVVYAMGPDNTSTSSETAEATVSNMPSGIPGIQPPTLAGTVPPGNVSVNLISAGTTIRTYAGVGFTQNVVATLTGYQNGQLDNHAFDFQAVVNWGDSNQWLATTILPNSGGGGTFVIEGSHTYSQPGTYPITVFAIGPDGTSTSDQTDQASVASNPSPSSWRAQDVGTGSDNKARLLWHTYQGAEDVWSVNNSFSATAGPVNGPLAGWTPIATAAGTDGLTRVLWTNTSGQAALWLVDANGNLSSSAVFGPFGNWTATDVAVGSDNAARILWDNGNGEIRVWKVDNYFGVSAGPVYGPYGGWTATRIAAGADGLTRVLWANASGAADLWLLNGSGVYQSSAAFGPIAGWTATDIAVSSNGQVQLLWTNASGAAALWAINGSYTVTGTSVYGPISGWQATSLSAGADGVIRLLWDSSNNAAALWLLGNNGAFQGAAVFGPY